MNEIAIVTDSTSDIPYDLAEQYGIQIVPNVLVMDGKTIQDDQYFSRQEFYTRLPDLNPLPTTSTASAGAYQAAYEQLFQRGIRSVLSIHASRLLSGIYNAASLASQMFGGRVRVVDSQNVSMGLGFQVLVAAEAAWQGLGMAEILARVEEVGSRVRLVAMLDTLEYIRRSGRISWARAGLGSFLHIKLFVEVKNGVVNRLGEVRTRKKAVARLLQLLQQQGPLDRLALLHTNAESEARQLLESLDLHLPFEPLLVNVTTVIGTHVGPNGLGFAAVVK